jgi:hypothetical protein
MAAPMSGTVTGLPELQADVAKMLAAVPAELGRANARIGPRAIASATPTPLEVGAGEGAIPRVVVDRNTLRIEAGGPWRAENMPQAAWGAQPAPIRAGKRPYLVGGLEAELSDATGEYLDAVLTAAKKIGWPVTQIIKT